MSDTLVKVENISKKFCRSLKPATITYVIIKLT
jgi:hypothetical protein